MSDAIALYIHFPFCLRKCNYCSFVSYQDKEDDISTYLQAMNREVELRTNGEQVRSIYLGGGTPSLLSPWQIYDVLDIIQSSFLVIHGAEVTLEANPGTIDRHYLEEIRKLGINRLSLGVQSLDDDTLSILGRIHTVVEARDAIEFARDVGFTNVNVDLIYGVPGQSLDNWNWVIEDTIALEPDHISLYPLTLEDGLPLTLAIENEQVPPLDSDIAADQYELAEDCLESSGYIHYEISNWARSGKECSHNMVYWCGGAYIGIGVAAHSYMHGRRCANTSDLDLYLESFYKNRLPIFDLDEYIGRELQVSETIILGLRLSDGIDLHHASDRFGIDLIKRYNRQICELTSLGLLECRGERVALTRRGRLLGNQVFWRFLPDGELGTNE
ncbi:MAG: radical SAM family heme chaperone HemW [Chloroflexota bacterium]|nr:radical SAM family heme chaperone HemW [Chloroflexota bacterium]